MVKIQRHDDYDNSYYYYLNVSESMLTADRTIELRVSFGGALRATDVFAVDKILDELGGESVSVGEDDHLCRSARLISPVRSFSPHGIRLQQ